MKKLNRKSKHQFTSGLKSLPLAIGSMMLASVTGHTSDIELYKSATSGGATIMMMLDTSASMGYNSIKEDYPEKNFSFIQAYNSAYCYNDSGYPLRSGTVRQKIYNNDGTDTGTTIDYPVTYCSVGGKNYFDRLSRLKMALMPLFGDPKTAFDGDDFSIYKIGLGQFFYEVVGGGKITHPATDLSLDNRKKMLDIVANMRAEANTPTAHAYAEAGAYMLGTSTGSSSNTSFANYSGLKRQLSDASTFTGNNYNSPITSTTTSTSQCGGYGIYFLTDGEPNGSVFTNTSSSATVLMNNSLVGGGTSISKTSPAGSLSSANTYYARTPGDHPSWEYIGQYAKALRNKNNSKATELRTAAVGFGSVFKQLENAGKVNKTVTNSDGTTSSVSVYNCESSTVTSADAKNLCRLAEKGYGFGEGGFFYTSTPDGIANSVVTFINETAVKEIPATSTGNMSVPLDALNTQQSRGYAYTPILDPKPGSKDLWNGNLKKYYIRNSTVTSDATGNTKVFKNMTGQFATNTQDLWNTISDTTRQDTQKPDKALPQVGGAYQQVFEKDGNDRNLWVNVNGTLTNIKVDATSKKPSGFTALKPVLRTDLVAPATGVDNVRLPVVTDILNKILVFIGYPQQSVADINDDTVITGTQSKTPKNIGGVLHSVPQLVTYGVTLDSRGKFNANTRQDSVLYGSMDGALHLIDDKTGKEQFTFIPKEILDLQSGALLKSGTAEDGKMPYGVDAPWSVYATYNIDSTTTGTGAAAVTTSKYATNQVFAAGGLRMGGSTYYNLDITNSSSPSLIYSVGSNYANVLQGKATTLQGMQNGTYGTSGDQAAFARMGQSWGKPSVGFVKSGGKKVMVNFLPGGYDTCYESATFKLGDSTNTDANCQNKTQAQGNAVYMVRVGEEKENPTTKKLTIDTTADKGKLLWWASYASGKDGSTTSARPTSVTLQKSEHNDLTNSIVTEIRTVDRNYDGLTDFIYFADLGGRVWRADINNNKDTDNFRVDRIVKLLDVSAEKAGTDSSPRFYERPLFTVTDEVVDGEPMAQITVGTGNRSLPVSDKRDSSKPDAIYSFMDREAGKKKLFCYKSDSDCKGTAGSDPYLAQELTTKNLTVANLAKLSFTATDATIKTNMQLGTTAPEFKHGWYYPLEQWYKVTGKGDTATMTNTLETDATQLKGMKMFNEPDAVSSILFVSVYNPNVNLMADSCSAAVQGATQRMLMCLPFGNCGASGYNTSTSANGTKTTDYTKRSAALAGAGIINNIITQSKPNEGGSLYGVLQLKCEGADCDKTAIPRPSNIEVNTINKIGNDRSGRINPREWWEK